jgi:hypothetical protein
MTKSSFGMQPTAAFDVQHKLESSINSVIDTPVNVSQTLPFAESHVPPAPTQLHQAGAQA